MAWIQLRQLDTETQKISTWTGFNIQTHRNVTINAPATQLSTVHEVLEETLWMREKLDLQSILVIFDQAMYSKAMAICGKIMKGFNP